MKLFCRHEWKINKNTVRVYNGGFCKEVAWKHHDGSMYDDYFIVGVNTKEGQHSYHYHKEHWEKFLAEELEFAPE